MQTSGWGGGHTGSGEPTSSLAFLPEAELAALTKEQLVCPPPSACAVSPRNGICVNSTSRPVPSWQVFLPLKEEDALREREKALAPDGSALLSPQKDVSVSPSVKWGH